MKLTWFASTCLRLNIAGEIVVFDPDRAPAGIDPAELVSGADHVVSFSIPDHAHAEIDPVRWRRRPARRPLDAIDGEPDPLVFWRIGEGAMLVEGDGEAPVVLVAGPAMPEFGRWVDGAVIVLFGSGEALVAWVTVLLDVARPRLIALAADTQTLDRVIDEVREHLQGVALLSLEPSLAVEA